MPWLQSMLLWRLTLWPMVLQATDLVLVPTLHLVVMTMPQQLKSPNLLLWPSETQLRLASTGGMNGRETSSFPGVLSWLDGLVMALCQWGGYPLSRDQGWHSMQQCNPDSEVVMIESRQGVHGT